MKKIIAILLALAVVSMAFAQTVNMSNTLETRPTVYVNGGAAAWEWAAERQTGAFLRNTVEASGETGDGRGKFDAWVYEDLRVTDPAGAGLLNILPRIGFTAPWADVAASYKAADFLAFGFGTKMLPYVVGGYLGSVYDFPGVDGGRENGSAFNADWAWNSANFWNGAFVTFLGDGVGFDGFKASLRFCDDWLNKNSFSFGVHASYDAGIFGASVKYDGTFGANGSAFTVANNKGIVDRKGDYTHEFALGVAYRGLKELAVGIDLGAAFDAILGKDANGNSTKMGIGASANFDFRNGITNKVWGRVGFGTVYGQSYKVLPFGVGDELTYAIGGDYNSKFIFEIAYLQNGMNDKLKTALATPGNSADIYVYPSFSFTMGKNDFLFGVKNDITGHLSYVEKTADDWAHTKVWGDAVRVEIPIKWTYHF